MKINFPGKSDMHNLSPLQAYEYYWSIFEKLSRQTRFHFLSRTYLIANDERSGRMLQAMYDQQLKDMSQEDCFQYLMGYLDYSNKKIVPERRAYLKRYPQMRSFSRDAFTVLFAKRLWGIDMKDVFFQRWPKNNVETIVHTLLNDTEAILELRTYALNFLHLYTHFFKPDDHASLLIQMYDVISNNWKARLLQTNGLRDLTYFVTHQIINDSLFYTRAIPSEHIHVHQDFLKRLSTDLTELPIHMLTVDCLCERALCYRLLDLKSANHDRVLAYVSQQKSSRGNYLIQPGIEDTLGHAEHRNVLYYLAFRQ